MPTDRQARRAVENTLDDLLAQHPDFGAELSKGERKVLVLMWLVAQKSPSRECFLSPVTIAEICELSERWTRYATDKLATLAHLTKRQVERGDGLPGGKVARKTLNLWRVTLFPHAEARDAAAVQRIFSRKKSRKKILQDDALQHLVGFSAGSNAPKIERALEGSSSCSSPVINPGEGRAAATPSAAQGPPVGTGGGAAFADAESNGAPPAGPPPAFAGRVHAPRSSHELGAELTGGAARPTSASTVRGAERTQPRQSGELENERGRAQAVLRHWRDQLAPEVEKFRRSAWVDLVVERLREGFSKHDLCRAVDGAKVSPYNREKPTARMPSHIFRSAATVRALGDVATAAGRHRPKDGRSGSGSTSGEHAIAPHGRTSRSDRPAQGATVNTGSHSTAREFVEAGAEAHAELVRLGLADPRPAKTSKEKRS